MISIPIGLKPLLRLLRSHDIAVKAHACRALFAIAANDENKLAISDAGGLSLLLECMTVGNVQVQVNAAGKHIFHPYVIHIRFQRGSCKSSNPSIEQTKTCRERGSSHLVSTRVL